MTAGRRLWLMLIASKRYRWVTVWLFVCASLLPLTVNATVIAGERLVVPSVRGDLPPCAEPFEPSAAFPRRPGERLVYSLELLGLHVGDVHFETAKRGHYRGKSATVYRSWLQPDGLVDALLQIEGRSTSIVLDDSFVPAQSVTRYRFRNDRIDETQLRTQAGKRILSNSSANGKKQQKVDAFTTETYDFVSGFLLLRRLPVQSPGCAVVYTHDRLYTAWVNSDGSERVDTPQGRVNMSRYLVRYGTSTSKTIRTVRVWLWPGEDRVPYQIRGESDFSPVARLSSYKRGGL